MKLEEMRKIAEARTKGKWWSAYHNRVEAWTITHELKDDVIECDSVNDWENIVATAPSGDSKHSSNTDFIALAANTYDSLLDIAEAAQCVDQFGNTDWEILHKALKKLEEL